MNAGVGPVRSLVVGGPNYLIVGGTGYIAYSYDGGATFTTIVGNAGESYRIARDPNFAVNNTIYLADSLLGRTYRLAIGTDSAPIDLLAPNSGTPVVSLLCRSGALYSVHPFLAHRTLQPLGTPGTLNWRTMDCPGLPPPGMNSATVDVNNIVYARNSTAGSPQLWAYSDYLATARPVLTYPASGAVVNPGEPVTLLWNALGSGTGLVTAYQVQITETWIGWGGATTSGDIWVALPYSPVVTMSTGGQFAFTLLIGREYWWRVRAAKNCIDILFARA